MIKLWGNTDVGIVRKQNEDNLRFRSTANGVKGYAIVCDGMGGANAGEVASEMAVELFAEQADALLQQEMDLETMRAMILRAAEARPLSEAAAARIFQRVREIIRSKEQP